MLVAACSGPGTASPASARPGSAHVSSRPSVALSTGGIVEYEAPVAVPRPDCTVCPPDVQTVALGPDGNVWYVDAGQNLLGRVSPTGQIAQFHMPYQVGGGARAIVGGPGGAVWVVARGSDNAQPDWVLRVGSKGEVTKYPTLAAGAGTESIAVGPDGNLWFTEFSANRVARLTTSGTVTEYATQAPNSSPRGIVAGPDGNIWFAETNRNRIAIGRITPEGQQTDFPLTQGESDATPYDLAAGPDGNVWFTTANGGGLAHISPSGAIVRVALPTGSGPVSVVGGPDGNMWFTDRAKNAIGRASMAGAIREFALPQRNGSGPHGIALGGDGRIWFGDSDRIGSVGARVPETLFSQPDNIFGRQVIIYADASAKTLKVTNRGDGTMVFASVSVSGMDRAVFVKGNDTCSGRSLDPGASCIVTVAHRSGGPSSVQSALLEIPDNATASPQKISLVAQLPNCRLPISISVPNQPWQGAQLDLSTGHALYDAAASFEANGNPGAVRTTAMPILAGSSSAYFDRAASRWLPVSNGAAVSAYDPTDPGPVVSLHVVDIATGRDRTLSTPPGLWSILGFSSEGIYVDERYEGIGPGLSVVNPESGAIRQVLKEGAVNMVTGSTAWVGVSNPADKLPAPPGIGGWSNEIDKRDLSTGATTTWFYAPGTSLNVYELINGSPVVTIWDGLSTRSVLVTSPNRSQPFDLPFTPDSSQLYAPFVSDPAGVWIGSGDGVYLWTARTGAVLVSDEPAVPAGTCA